jgi:tight adherence protein B
MRARSYLVWPGGLFLCLLAAVAVVAPAVRSPVALLVVGLAVGAFSLLLPARRRSRLRDRLAPQLAGERRRRPSDRRRSPIAASISRAAESALGDLRAWKHLSRLLERADLPLRTVELLYLVLGSTCAAAALIVLAGGGGAVACAGAGLAAVAPLLFVQQRARRRPAAFARQLPDLLDTVGAALKGGRSFAQGLEDVVAEGREPAAGELRRVLTETALGRPMDEALESMSGRLGSEDVDFVVTAITIQGRAGGNLADLIDTVGDTIQQRQQLHRRVSSSLALGRICASVLVGLPFLVAGSVAVADPGHMSPLFATAAGRMLVAGGSAAVVIGSLLLRKIVSFKG